MILAFSQNSDIMRRDQLGFLRNPLMRLGGTIDLVLEVVAFGRANVA
jgi:hypothetical protein